MQSPNDRLRALGLELPTAPKPVAAYIPAVRAGRLLFVSGQLPFRAGELISRGCVPADLSVEAAQDAARQCALNGLAVVAAHVDGDLSRVVRIVRVGVFVASAPGFGEQPKVANGASELLVQVFGETGRHARAAVGCSALPLNAPVEVELTVEID
jgi:enamine deaminase RidA (YjgF/YER057c/UK114 family)